jgi:hypothetical protein
MATNVKISQLPGTANLQSGDLFIVDGYRNGGLLTTYSLSAGEFFMYKHGVGTCSIIPVDGNNTASGLYSGVTGGVNNKAYCDHSVVAGGANNCAASCDAAVVGGQSNTACGIASFIGGGSSHTACGSQSTIAGGFNNSTCKSWSAVLGGYGNNAFGNYSGVLGGLNDQALGDYSSVINGRNNTASGFYSSILGGQNNDTKNYANTFILGSGLSANQVNYTYVNNISSQGNIVAKSVRVNDGSYPTAGLTNTTMGSGTFVTNASALITTSAVTNNSRIFITIQDPRGSIGTPFIASRVSTTSFTVSSTNLSDRSGFAWLIIEPA